MKSPTHSGAKPSVILLPHHQQMLDDSAIAREVIEARGYRSATKKVELSNLGFVGKQNNVPSLLIPVYGPTGEIALHQSRPDFPRIRDGKKVKYETPAGARMGIDVPPAARVNIGNPEVPLFITEGVKKADAAVSQGLCCIALLGVWNWRGSNESGGKVALPDWEYIALKDRRVNIVFDSDVMENPAVHAALVRFKAFLESRGAR